jgi:hypothetical protein
VYVDANAAVMLHFVLMIKTRLFTVEVEPKHVGGPLIRLRFMRHATRKKVASDMDEMKRFLSTSASLLMHESYFRSCVLSADS